MDLRECERNLMDAQFFAHNDPYPLFRFMRDNDPVHWCQGDLREGIWGVFRYEDCRAVYGDARTFSSALNGITTKSSPELEAVAPIERGAGLMLVMSDNPLHLEERKAFRNQLLPTAVRKLESRVRQIVTELIDNVAAAGRCDFVIDIAARLPMAVICELMGIDRGDWDNIFRWTNMALGPEDSEYQINNSPVDTQRYGYGEIYAYTTALAHKRQGLPVHDLLGMLGNVEMFGKRLSDPELGANGFMFISGGFETTRNALSGAMLQFIRQPDDWRRLGERPELMPTAIEEILRFTTPVTQLGRTATVDTEVGGKKIKAGDRVAVWMASADHDERVFPDPERFDIARTPNNHIALGYGEHFCLGAHLARMEIRLLQEELWRRIPDIALAGDVQRLASNGFAGIKHMPVKFTPESTGVRAHA
jgi:cytochrome P450